jgi:hypothetical protein
VAIVAANGSTTAGILNERGEVRLVDVGDISNFTSVKIGQNPAQFMSMVHRTTEPLQ